MKTCPYCLTELSRRPNGKDDHWAKRRYCDKSCAGKHGGEKRASKKNNK